MNRLFLEFIMCYIRWLSPVPAYMRVPSRKLTFPLAWGELKSLPCPLHSASLHLLQGTHCSIDKVLSLWTLLAEGRLSKGSKKIWSQEGFSGEVKTAQGGGESCVTPLSFPFLRKSQTLWHTGDTLTWAWDREGLYTFIYAQSSVYRKEYRLHRHLSTVHKPIITLATAPGLQDPWP